MKNVMVSKMKYTTSKAKESGKYDGGYAEKEEPIKTEEEKKESVPGVPGTAEDKKEEGGYDKADEKKAYDDKYVEPKAEDKTDEKKAYDDKYVEPKAEDKTDESEDMEECTCDKCGSKYKAKKQSEEDKKDSEKDDSKEEEDTDKNMASLNFGSQMKVQRPTKDECLAAKSVKVNMNEIFGRKKADNKNSLGRQMTNWAMNELQNLTPKRNK